MRVHLLTFIAGMENEEIIIKRFTKQAVACTYIDTIRVVNRGDEFLKIFNEEYGSFIKNNPRGYGYWLWKPYIIYKYMSELPKGDVLFYCDIGCELSPMGGKKFNKYLDKFGNLDIVAFSTFNNQPEYMWCKKELVDFLKLPIKYLEKEQVAATYLLVKVSDRSFRIILEWLLISKSNNCNLINDSLSMKQSPGFVEHRHDQAILSLLLKKNGAYVFREQNYFSPFYYYKNSYVYQYPIHALRSKGKKYFLDSRTKYSKIEVVLQYILFKCINITHRLYKKII